MSRCLSGRSLALAAALLALGVAHCGGDDLVGTGTEARPDAGRRVRDAGAGVLSDAGGVSDAGTSSSDAGSDGVGTCEACATDADCGDESACIAVAAGQFACVPRCERGNADTCPEGFACDFFVGQVSPVCVPAGLVCCVDHDGDRYGQGLHCRGPDCNDADRSVNPSGTERCNGLDDDCDGQLPPGEADADGDLVRVCEGDCDDLLASVRPGAPEICDGRDNDCDGMTPADESDEDADGVRRCAGDCDDQSAATKPGASELCNGRDDDCDGTTPSVEQDVDGDLRRVCDNDCDDRSADIHPGAPERCNGVDDDCDGTVPLGEADGDADGVRVCAGDCNDLNPLVGRGLPELCDTLDNDCNDLADDGQTSCGVGVCRQSVATCFEGGTQVCVPGDPDPAGESCNGLDDNCDGVVDEGFGEVTCGVGECLRVARNCVEGVPAVCTEGTAVTEICNGKDDDCDGLVDEDNAGGGGACNTGLHGLCAVGVHTCRDGALACDRTLNPGAFPDVCNGSDDDCDGVADEGNPGGGLACNTGQDGLCAAGTTRCDSATHQVVCAANVTVATETCDGFDNDCDGVVDEGFGSVTCGIGECRRTVVRCSGGAPAQCVAGSPEAEICDGKDNDCDGVVDEGRPGEGTACTTGFSGACSPGVTFCSGGHLDCRPAVAPGSQGERCNGVDDNCNGLVDEGDPEGGAACNTGQPGACAAGTFHCSGVTLACVPNGPPVAEQCNGLDDDCNGEADDNIAPLTCGTGGCARSVARCLSGVTQTCVPGPVKPEICNGEDDDCNGVVDNAGPSLCPNPSNTATTSCSAGQCAVTGCAPSYYDVDVDYMNGCECQDDISSGPSCGAATCVGSLSNVGTLRTHLGRIPFAGWEDHYFVDFPSNYDFREHSPGRSTVSLVLNEGSVFRFEVSYGTCTGTSGCASNLTAWEFADSNAPPAGDGQWIGRSTTWPTRVFVRVWRVSGRGCERYQLKVAR